MKPIAHDFIDYLKPRLGSFEEIRFPMPSSRPDPMLGSPHYIRRIDVRSTDYSVRAGVELHDVPHDNITHKEDVTDAVARSNPPKREQLTIQHYSEPAEHPGLWCNFDYTTPKHTITHEEPTGGEHNPQRKRTAREAYKQSKQYLPDVAKQSTRTKPERRLDIVEPRHTLTDEIHKYKDDLSKFLDAYITHLQR